VSRRNQPCRNQNNFSGDSLFDVAAYGADWWATSRVCFMTARIEINTY